MMGFFSNTNKSTGKLPLSRSWHGTATSKRGGGSGSGVIASLLKGGSGSSGNEQNKQHQPSDSLRMKKPKWGSNSNGSASTNSKKDANDSESDVPALLDEKEYLKSSRMANGNGPKGLSRSAHGLSRSLHGLKRSMHGLAKRLGGERGDDKGNPPRVLKSCLKKPHSKFDELMMEVSQSSLDAYEGEELDSFLKARRPAPKSVKFVEVEVREYSSTYCHHPCVKDGLAVSLGWYFSVLDPISVDHFEAQRPPRISRDKMLLDYMTRVRMVRSSGASMKEIRKSMELTRRARNGRLLTLRKVREEDFMNFELEQMHRNLQLGKRCIEEFNGDVIDT